MTLRTQPRRISPRSKRRYQAIRNFFRRALGNEFKINSNIALNIANYDNTTSRSDNVSISLCDEETPESSASSPRSPDPPSPPQDDYNTRVLYDNRLTLQITDISDSQTNYRTKKETLHRKRAKSNLNMKQSKAHPSERPQDLTQSSYNFRNRSDSTCGYDVPDSAPRPAARAPRGPRRDNRHPTHGARHRTKQNDSNQQMFIDGGTCSGNHKTPNREDKVLDDNYILGLIKRQYEPTVMGDIQHSSLSQFSAPVCRDRDSRPVEPAPAAAEECSCCPGRHRRGHRDGIRVNEMRSMCDTQLHNKHRRSKPKTRKANILQDASQYDLIPVKETSSPNTRRKFAEDIFRYSREVPPSPKSHRPQLNLRTQYNNYEEYVGKFRKNALHKRHGSETDVSSELFSLNPHDKSRSAKINQSSENFTKQNSPLVFSNTMDNDNIVNKACDSISKDKTLIEIKDILQNFLQEMKKESSILSSPANSVPPETPTVPNVSQNVPVNQCTYTPPIVNAITPPYFSMVPLCPVNCIHNAYPRPCSCTSPKSDTQNTTSTSDGTTVKSENSELLKEIYKVISENRQKKVYSNSAHSELGKKDAEVDVDLRGSRSCDAVSQRRPGARCAGGSCSDTVIDRMSLPDTVRTFDSSFGEDKPKGFAKFLQKVGIRKKKGITALHKGRCGHGERDPSPYRREDDAKYVAHHQNPCLHRPSYYRYPQPGECCTPGLRGYDRRHPHDDRPPQPGPLRASAPPYATVYGLHGDGHPTVVLKEVEMKTVSTQFEPKRFSLLNKIKQKVREVRAQSTSPSETDTPQRKKRSFLDTDANILPKDFGLGDDKVRCLLVKKFLRPSYPFGPRKILENSFFGKETTECGKQRPVPHPKNKVFL